MRKIWLVARNEVLTNIRKRAFLFAAIGAPLITVVLMIIVIGVTVDFEGNISRFSQIGVVDEANVITYYDDPTASYEDPPMPMFVRYDNIDSAQAALDAEQIGAYMLIPGSYLSTGTIRLFTAAGTPEALTDSIETYMRTNVGKDLDPAVLRRIIHPSDDELYIVSTGRTMPREAMIGALLLPIFFISIFMIASQTTSGYLMSGVVEEKTNRIMEILITTVTPVQLLAGKILGLGLLGLLQVAVWAVISIVAIIVTNAIGSSLLSGIFIPLDLAFYMVVYLVLGYFFLATVMAGIGAVVGSEQESRQFAGIFSLVLVIPFFVFITFITDPNGTVPTVLSILPITSPSAMIMRMSFTNVPAEQIILSIVLLIALNIFVLWVSARIFRFALLMVGKRLNVLQILRLLSRRVTRTGMVTQAVERSEA